MPQVTEKQMHKWPRDTQERLYRLYYQSVVFAENDHDRERLRIFLDGVREFFGFTTEEAKAIETQTDADLAAVNEWVDWVLKPETAP